jgi:acetyl-CoA C-acetyltransferase
MARKFADGIVAVEVRGKKGMEPFTADEAPRPDTTIEGLAKLLLPSAKARSRPATHPGLNSGAAALIIADRPEPYGKTWAIFGSSPF